MELLLLLYVRSRCNFLAERYGLSLIIPLIYSKKCILTSLEVLLSDDRECRVVFPAFFAYGTKTHFSTSILTRFGDNISTEDGEFAKVLV